MKRHHGAIRMNNRNKLALLGIAVVFAVPLLIFSQRETPPESTIHAARTLAEKRRTGPSDDNQVLEDTPASDSHARSESTSLAIPLNAAEIRILEDKVD